MGELKIGFGSIYTSMKGLKADEAVLFARCGRSMVSCSGDQAGEWQRTGPTSSKPELSVKERCHRLVAPSGFRQLQLFCYFVSTLTQNCILPNLAVTIALKRGMLWPCLSQPHLSQIMRSGLRWSLRGVWAD